MYGQNIVDPGNVERTSWIHGPRDLDVRLSLPRDVDRLIKLDNQPRDGRRPLSPTVDMKHTSARRDNDFPIEELDASGETR